MSFKKNLKKLFSEPVEMRIEEVENILMHFGYSENRLHGSHFIFTKPNCDTITVPVHNGKTTKYYIKTLKEIIINLI